MYWFLIISIYCEKNNTVILLTIDFDIQIYLYLFSERNFFLKQHGKTEYPEQWKLKRKKLLFVLGVHASQGAISN
jgi:hypothetical protein